MSIELTTICLSLTKKLIPSTEKHVLTILCFRANQKFEVFTSIERLIIDCGYSKNTIEKSLSALRKKNILLYTGKFIGKSGKIPVYKINIHHPNTLGDKNIITQIEELDHPKSNEKITPASGVHKDNKNKDNKKDNGFSLEPTQQEKNDVKYYLNSSYKMPDELQPTYLWLSENGKI